jgi:hypothetical protein
VFDCFAPWRSSLPPDAAAALDRDDEAAFDAFMWAVLDAIPESRQNWLFRARPYGTDSPFDVFRAAEQYTLEGVADKITCPTLLCDPEGEQFWPGQAERLYNALTGPKWLEKFTASEGASLHCEPLAIATRNLRMFDWLDDQLGR